ncbi:lysoplasmalogenase [Microbacterium sp. CFH 31415]|uniref:lysoplasmalogenase n=1 Tax=Microbacterium sp. CFH 31415 TaxID=2921732 RepID=UPI001F13836F|nr:lysoplasmalogenase [Microbacterium sp. CFH 31415]MCH6229878.1 lysoplasmalogenase [Microbacterium sp. CFH 31415]
MSRLLIGFIPYVAMSLVHVATLAAGAHDAADPTKLMLMPFLALAVVWGADRAWTRAHALLVTAIALSWLGDGAGPLFDWLPTVPMMLLFFGLAHLCYIWLFWRVLPVRRVPLWALGYAVWYVALLAVLWPSLGALLVPVAVYGLILGATAVGAARCHPLIAWGGLFFLASDSVLAFRLFMPEVLPDWSSPLVMATYCLGQGLIAAGVVVSARRLRIPVAGAAAVVEKEHV